MAHLIPRTGNPDPHHSILGVITKGQIADSVAASIGLYLQ
jgi:hypothetical protein